MSTLLTECKPYAIFFLRFLARRGLFINKERKAAEMGSFTAKRLIRLPLYCIRGIGVELIGIEEGASIEKIEALCQKFNEEILPQLGKGALPAKIIDGFEFETVQFMPQTML